jgi:Nucleotidyl transferase AbiEii toxin, Type IV TA system
VDHSYFFDRLYPLQDDVLRVLSAAETGLYLSGGTAASRGYLQHRFSEDLDLFVNDDPSFGLWTGRFLDRLTTRSGWRTRVLLREARFVRLEVESASAALKIEMVNDVPAHVGAITVHPFLGRLDSSENILANKLTALSDRDEPKDLADIWGFCCRLGLSLSRALDDAASKAAGLFPPDLARRLLTASPADWELVRWITPPDPDAFLGDLRRLGEDLALLPPPP